jgi:hypothetical protein
VRRQGLCPALPTKSDAATELAVPQPPPKTWKPWDFRPVRQRNRVASRFSIDETREKRVCVGGDARQFFLSSRRSAYVVGRPASLESCDIAGQVLSSRPDELHAFFHSVPKDITQSPLP